ncbi:MAG: hypothetical protein JNK43_07335 [Ignavibacteria bacterium]|nr:hypothetical protein [Ignavibacteria bacterium]
MKNTDLIELLKYFDQSDIKSFSKFLSSPYFNSNKAAVSLFSEIRKYYPEFNSDDFNKQNIYSKVFPVEKYNDVKMRKLISDLNKLAEKYLSVERLTKNEKQMYNSLLLFKKEKSFFNKNESHLRNWENLLSSSKSKIDEEYYYFRFSLNSLKAHFESFKSTYVPNSKNTEFSSLICYFALKAMQIRCVAQIYILIYSIKEFDNTLIEELLNLEITGYFSSEPLIGIYCNIVRLFNLDIKESRILLQSVHNAISEMENRISNQEKLFLYWVVSQYLILVSKRHILTEFRSLKWHYLKKQIEIEIEEGGKLSWPVYISIVNNGLTQNELEWTEKFIIEFTNLVSSEEKNVIAGWAEAKLLNAKGEYSDSQRKLQLINTNLRELKYDIDSLTIINYYELKKYNELSYHLQAFNKYLSKTAAVRDKDIQKSSGGGFIMAVNLLVKLQYSTNPSQKIKIINKLNKIIGRRILYRKWIVEKLEALK